MSHDCDVIVRFGRCELDLDRVEVRVDGVQVQVEPQVFDVLAYLVEHRERLVPKEELLDNVWGDRFVSESALTSRIKTVRQVVGDSGREQAVIKTVHRRGYRFVAQCEVVDRPAESDYSSTVSIGVGTGTGSGTGFRSGSAIDAPAGPADDPDSRWPLVGRHEELAEVGRVFRDDRHGGILLTGPVGMGKTRLARECLEYAEQAGWPVARVDGHAEAGLIPLAAMAHLLPLDVLEATGHQGEMERAAVFRRARSTFEERSGDKRLVLMIDNVDRIDDMSTALIGSLITAGTIFAVMTQRTARGDTLVMDELVRSGRVSHIDLDPLADTDLDVLLYRVLAGPIELASLNRLTDLAAGSPGALQELVTSSLANNTLGRHSDVWRLTGPIQPSIGLPGVSTYRLSDLDPAVRRGAELIAIAGDLDLDLAADLMDADVLDELDHAGLLALTEGPRGARVMLAHAHLAPMLLESLGQLRLRRHKIDLVTALAAAEPSQEDRLDITRWSVETGAQVERDELVESARFAVANADGASADVLLDHLAQQAPGSDVVQLRAELCFQRGQMSRAEQLFRGLDLTQLEPRIAATAVRRQATIMFHARGRYAEAIDVLGEREHDFEPGVRELVTAHWIGLQGFFGNAGEVIRRAGELPDDLELAPRLEVLRSLGQAYMLRGEMHLALETLGEHERLAVELPAGVAQPGFETAMSARISCHYSLGEIERSAELVREHLPVGRRTILAWLPIAAARTELAAGRARMARELIQTPLAAVRSQNLLHAEPLMTGLHAQALAHLGEVDEARAAAVDAASSLESLEGQLRLALSAQLTDIWLEVGERDKAVELALPAAERAREIGNLLSEAELLGTAASAGAAREVVDRLEEVVGGIDGWLWPLRLRLVRAMAATPNDKRVLGDIELEFRRLGYGRLADLTQRARN